MFFFSIFIEKYRFIHFFYLYQFCIVGTYIFETKIIKKRGQINMFLQK